MLKEIRLTLRFFVLYFILTGFLLITYLIPRIQWISEFSFYGLGLLILADLMILFLFIRKPNYERKFQERLSLGDDNTITVSLRNVGPLSFQYRLYEGFPSEMEERSLVFKNYLKPMELIEHSYSFTPKKRGAFSFSETYLFIHSLFGMVERRLCYSSESKLHVYPSVIQMKKYELLVFQQNKTLTGLKRIRRIGNAKEFEHIKNYVQGDELKTINWKATSRKNELMVNQYQEEKSQNIYCIIDKGRIMQMQSNGLTMLDYAINSTLVVANICLLKGDKIGMFTYSNKLGASIPAENKKTQLKKIMDSLYTQQTLFHDSNFELMQQHVNEKVKARSLLMLFTNFENPFTLKRALPYLHQLNKRNILLVIMFQNEELNNLSSLPPTNAEKLYSGLVAGKMVSEKQKMQKQLNAIGIQTILTLPQDLSFQVINKYLAMKAKGIL